MGIENIKYDAVFSLVFNCLIKIEDKNETAKALSRLINIADNFDAGGFLVGHKAELKEKHIDFGEIQTKKHKKWSLEKLCLFFINQCWNQNQYELGIQWYLIVGTSFEFENKTLETVKNKRDIEKSRILVSNMKPNKNTFGNVPFLGVFMDWWCEPLEKKSL